MGEKYLTNWNKEKINAVLMKYPCWIDEIWTGELRVRARIEDIGYIVLELQV